MVKINTELSIGKVQGYKVSGHSELFDTIQEAEQFIKNLNKPKKVKKK